jgi:two-component system cell cycle sensor histidine kinase/response regulator CckA
VNDALETLLRGENPVHFQAAGISTDRGAIDIAVTLSAIVEMNGAVAGGSAIRDITEHCRLEEQFRHSQKMEAVGRLAGGVAHDFNNLLTVILGYSSVLEKRLGSADTLSDTVAEIRRAAEDAALLTAQLLAFSRKQISEQRVLDLNNLVLGMQSMVQRLIGSDIELARFHGCVPGIGAGRCRSAKPGTYESGRQRAGLDAEGR